MCVCFYLSVCVGMHYKIKSGCKINYGKIISIISAYISTIRLRNIAGDLAGERVRVSGWGKTSDSKYNFLIILQFNFKNCTYQNDWFKGEETHGLQNVLWSLWMPSVYTVICRRQGLSKAVRQCYMNQPTGDIYIYIYIYSPFKHRVKSHLLII